MIKRHHNFDYNLGSPNYPLSVGDRYYAQDQERDFFHAIDKAGLSLKDVIKNKDVIIGKLDIRQKSGTDLMSIPSIQFYGSKTIFIPDDYSSIPPTLVQNKVQFIRGEATFKEFNIVGTATLDGATINYIKIQYKDVDGNTRNRAKASGSYSFEQYSSAVLTVDPIAPTSSEILLATLVGSGSGADWIILENEDLGKIDHPSYFSNASLQKRCQQKDLAHGLEHEISKNIIPFGTKFDNPIQERFFNHTLQEFVITPESSELKFNGGGWVFSNETDTYHGAKAVTSTIGDSVELEFTGVHCSIDLYVNNTSHSAILKCEIKNKGGEYKIVRLINQYSNIGTSGSGLYRRNMAIEDLPLDDYVVKFTLTDSKIIRMSAVSYGTYTVQQTIQNNNYNGGKILSISTSTEFFTVRDTSHDLAESDVIRIIGSNNASSSIGGVTYDQDYFVRNPTLTTFQLSLTDGGAIVNITSTSGHHGWIGISCANRTTDLDGTPIGATLVNGLVHSTNNELTASENSAWNELSLSGLGGLGASLEYRFTGDKIWMIYGIHNSIGDMQIEVTIDGSTTQVKTDSINPLKAKISASYSYIALALRLDDGTLKHGEHDVKIRVISFSSTSPVFSLQGWHHQSLPVWNDIHTDDIDFANNKILITDHEYNDNEIVKFQSDGIVPAGIELDKDYFVINKNNDDFKLSATRGGSAIPFTTSGDGVLSIYKVKSTQSNQWILGKDTIEIPASDTSITYTGTWDGVNLSQNKHWNSQFNRTVTKGSQVKITLPSDGNVRAVYLVVMSPDDDSRFISTLGGLIPKMSQAEQSGGGDLSYIYCLYDKTRDGELEGKDVVVESLNSGSGLYFDGFIVEMGDEIENDNLVAIQKEVCIGQCNQLRAEPISFFVRNEVCGAKTDNRQGVLNSLLTPWMIGTTTRYHNFPFSEDFASMNSDELVASNGQPTMGDAKTEGDLSKEVHHILVPSDAGAVFRRARITPTRIM